MEKSIESIWKEGFLKSDALVAPKLNDLYDKKSTHIVDKFKRMFKKNLIYIIIGSSVFLIASFIQGIPIIGISFFILLNIIVVVNKKLLNGLEKIDNSSSSYEYIKSFDNWMKEQYSVNRKMAQYYYPLFFLSMVVSFWISGDGQALMSMILGHPHEIYLIAGIPVFWVLGTLIITGLLVIFGGRIYKFDVSIIYGRVFKKLEEILADMEELRA